MFSLEAAGTVMGSLKLSSKHLRSHGAPIQSGQGTPANPRTCSASRHAPEHTTCLSIPRRDLCCWYGGFDGPLCQKHRHLLFTGEICWKGKVMWCKIRISIILFVITTVEKKQNANIYKEIVRTFKFTIHR